MERSEHIEAARRCLVALKKEPTRTRDLIEQMRRHALRGGFGLYDLGISTEEICDLMKGVAKIRAMKFVRELREAGRDEADYIDLIRESVAEADCTLADIGISEEELASFEDNPANLFE